MKPWIYLGTDIEWRIKYEKKHGYNLSTANALDMVATQNRQDYIDLIGKLSELNAPLDPLLWWSSELAAKNPYNGLYTRICLADMAKTLHLEERTDIRIVSPPLEPKKRMTDILDARPTIPGLGILSRSYGHYVTSRVDYRNGWLLGARFDIPPFTGDMFVTWMDSRNIDGNKYKDPHFGNLPFFLKDRGRDVAFLGRVLYNADFPHIVNRLDATGERIYFPERFITGKDYEDALLKARNFNPVVPEGETICMGNIEVKPFIDILVEESRGYHTKSLLYDPIIKGMVEREVKPSRIYYTCEGHAWESALVCSVRKYLPDTKIIAYDNGTFSRMNLAMFPSEKEFAIRPMPDKIVTSGEMYARTLLSAGYPADMIKVGCGLRHQYLFGDVRSTKLDRDDVVLVATSIDYGESLELISKAIEAFGRDVFKRVIIKLHPMIDQRKIMKSIGRIPSNVFISDKKISDLLLISDILLYGYSLVCFEALAHGVYPIFVKNENSLNLDKLEGLEVSASCATPIDIDLAVTSFLMGMSSEEKSEWMKKAKKVCRDALGEIDSRCIEQFVK